MKKVTYLNGTLTYHKPVTLTNIVARLKAEKIPKAIQSLRAYAHTMTPDEVALEGERIPAVIFPSVFKDGKWESYTGLVLIEFNRLGNFSEACRLRNLIEQYKKPLLAFVGCSGCSVKVVVPYTLPDGTLPATREEAVKFHAHAYMRVVLHYQEQFHRKVTLKEPVPDRVCRLSWDPDCCYNPDAEPILMEQPDRMPERKDEKIITAIAPYDPLAGLLPGLQRYEKISMLFENCKRQMLDEMGKTWQEDDPKSYTTQIARYCYHSAIPEETAVRWICYAEYADKNTDLVRQTVHNVYRTMKIPPGSRPCVSKYQQLVIQIEEFMERRYDVRHNEITGETEYRERNSFYYRFQPVTNEARNDMCMNAQKEGIPMVDPDIRRYIDSYRPERYNPLEDFLENLPSWDGTDRIRPLADRVPTTDSLWRDHFYVWFLSMVAHWMKRDRMYANSLVPVLSGAQGLSKSVFFRTILPPALQDYYVENINLENKTATELLMAQNLLINIDEFDRINRRHQAELKRLIQTPELKIRKPHQKTFRIIRRMSSFCATANPSELLTDPSGNRRYICVRLTGPVDVSGEIDYNQLYAQAVEAIRKGEHYWLNTEEEQRLSQSNNQFLQIPLEIQYTLAYFRKPQPDEEATGYKAAELLDIVARKSK